MYGLKNRCEFKSTLSCEVWIKRLNEIADAPLDLNLVFATRLRNALKVRFYKHPFLRTRKEILGLSGI